MRKKPKKGINVTLSEEQFHRLWRHQQRMKRLRQRRAWDAEHLRPITTKISPTEHERFKRLCAQRGTTIYAALQSAVREMLADYE